MADFVQTMRDWHRMCRAYANEDTDTSCDGCPLLEFSFDKRGCDAIYSDFADNANWAGLEQIVAEWVAEHPEPVYPTWFEWLEQIKVAGRAYDLEPYFTGDREVYLKTAAFTPKAFEPIPADIAERLGIGPKEVEE